MPPAPQVLASDAALKLRCSLSPKLSKLLSASGGALSLQIGVGETQTPRGKKTYTKAQIVSYVPGIAAQVTSGQSSPNAQRSHVASSKHLQGEWDDGPDYIPQVTGSPCLEFDRKEVLEYACSPTKTDPGVIWLDGEATYRTEMAWGPNAIRVMQAPRVAETKSEGNTSQPSGQALMRKDPSLTDIQVRVVDVRRGIHSVSDGGLTPEVSSLQTKQRPSSAPQVRRSTASAANFAENGRTPFRQTSSCPAGSHQQQASSIATPMVTQVTTQRWSAANPSSKQKLLRGAVYSPGEVSALIHEVQRRRNSSLGLKSGSRAAVSHRGIVAWK